MTNYDRIKQMSVDEMAEFMRSCDCENICVYYKEYGRIYENLECKGNCNEGIKEWLLSKTP